MKTNKNLSTNMENYLEAMLLLQQEHGHAHIKDIAEKLQIKMPSVTEALRKLKKSGLVNYAQYSSVTLTGQGRRIANKLLSRHQILFNFLHNILRVDKKTAEKDACQIEHVISRQAIKKISRRFT